MTDAALTPRQRAASLSAVIAATFGIGLFLGSNMPLVGVVLERWGVPGTLIGLNGAMPSLAILLLGPHLAGIARRLGTMPAMLGGLALGTAAILLMPALPNVWVWFPLRFLLGCGMALPWLVGETWINAVAPEATRARVIGVYSATLFAGMAVGPLALQVTGTEGFPPFLLGAAALALAALPLLPARHLAPAMQAVPSMKLSGVIRTAPTVAGAALIAGLSESAFYFLLPVYGVRVGLAEGPALTLLTVLIAGAIALQLPVGWLADRVDRRRLLGAMAALAAVLAPPLALAVGTPLFAWPLLFVLGGLALGYYTVGLALLGARFGPSDLAVANAAFMMLYETGSFAGPSLAGTAMDLWPPHGYLAVVTATALVFAGLAVRRGRRTP